MTIHDMIKEIVGLDKPLKGYSFMFGKDTTITATVKHNTIVGIPIIRVTGSTDETVTLNEDGKVSSNGNVLIWILPIKLPLSDTKSTDDIPELWEAWYNEHKNKPALCAPFERVLVIRKGVYRPDIFLYKDETNCYCCTSSCSDEREIIKYDESLVNKKAPIK